MKPEESLKALAVDKRLKIIESLKNKPMTVNALTEALGITQSAVSQHLRVLKQAGLVDDERKGYWVYYSLNDKALCECKESIMMICSHGCCCHSAEENATTEDKRKTLESYKRELENELRRVKTAIEAFEK
jgi:ArsR family transcriptional regulator